MQRFFPVFNVTLEIMLEKVVPDLQHLFKAPDLQTALIGINQKTNLSLGLMAACINYGKLNVNMLS